MLACAIELVAAFAEEIHAVKQTESKAAQFDTGVSCHPVATRGSG